MKMVKKKKEKKEKRRRKMKKKIKILFCLYACDTRQSFLDSF